MLAINGMPLFLTLLVVGVTMGMLQAATQINDPAIGFVPRITSAVMAMGAISTLVFWPVDA